MPGAAALDVVLESGDIDVHVPRGGALLPVLLLEILLVVHAPLNIVHKRDLCVSVAETLEAPLCLHCSWISWFPVARRSADAGDRLGSSLAGGSAADAEAGSSGAVAAEPAGVPAVRVTGEDGIWAEEKGSLLPSTYPDLLEIATRIRFPLSPARCRHGWMWVLTGLTFPIHFY